MSSLARFTDKELDASELYYFNARYYDPKIQRFITEDPSKQPVGWYTYCNNNPVNNSDFNGKIWHVELPIGGHTKNNYTITSTGAQFFSEDSVLKTLKQELVTAEQNYKTHGENWEMVGTTLNHFYTKEVSENFAKTDLKMYENIQSLYKQIRSREAVVSSAVDDFLSMRGYTISIVRELNNLGSDVSDLDVLKTILKTLNCDVTDLPKLVTEINGPEWKSKAIEKYNRDVLLYLAGINKSDPFLDSYVSKALNEEMGVITTPSVPTQVPETNSYMVPHVPSNVPLQAI